MRQDYTIVLEITPTAPLQHGAGNEGNEQVLHTREYLVQGEDGWERIDVPAVSGSALKATLREHAVHRALDGAGVEDGAVSKDALRLLLKGGRNDRGRNTLPLEEARRIRTLFPLLAVFGSMDGGLPIRGQVQCSDVTVWCAELVAEGLLPRVVTPMEVSVDGETITADMGIDIYPGEEPVPVHLAWTRTQNYRHDMRSSTMMPKLAMADQQAIEDARERVGGTKAAGKPAKATERRDANESMPYSAQCIAPGTPMVAMVRLHGATEVEFACLAHAIADWIRSGANLGGGSARGHGACRVRVAGALRYSPAPGHVGTEPGESIALGETPGARLASVYAEHVAEHAESVRAYCARTTR